MNADTPSNAPALAFGMALMVPAPDGVDDAISRVMGRHEEEFNAALEPFGVTLGVLAQATWMRLVRIGEVQALHDGQVHSSALAAASVASRRCDDCGDLDVPCAACAPLGNADPLDTVSEAYQLGLRDGLATDLLDDEGDELGENIGEAPMQADHAPAHALLPLAGRGCCGVNEACSASACTGAPASAPAVEGVYMTDQLRDPEEFGERIDDGKLSREEAIARGLLTEDGEPVADERLLEDHQVDLLGALRRSIEGARALQAEADANGYGRPSAAREAESEAARAAVRAEAAMERGDRG